MATAVTSVTVAHPHPGVIVQPVPQGVLLLDMDSGEYYSLEETGGRVWMLCDGVRTAEQVAGLLAEEFDVSVDVVREDVVEVLTDMVSAGLLVLA